MAMRRKNALFTDVSVEMLWHVNVHNNQTRVIFFVFMTGEIGPK